MVATRGRLVARPDHQAGVEHVRDELIEVIATVGSELGPDVLPLAIDLVAEGADSFEDGLAGHRIARRFAQQARGSRLTRARASGLDRRELFPTAP